MIEPVTGATGLEQLSTRIHRTSLQVKITALGAIVTLLVLFAAFWAVSVEAHRSTRARIADQLNRQQSALLRIQRQNLAQLVSSAAIITQSPTLRQALSISRVEANSGAARVMHANTVQGELAKLLARVDADLLVVTNDEGRVFAATARSGGPRGPERGDDLSGVSAVRQALDPDVNVDSGALAIYRNRDFYYQAAVQPIVQGGYTIGALILGQRIDSNVVASARSALSGEVVVTAGRGVLVSSLGARADNSLAELLLASVATQETPVISAAGEEFVVDDLTLGKVQTGEEVTMWLMQPLGPAVRTVTNPLLKAFTLYGALAVIIAAIGSGLVTHSVLSPFRQFVKHMGSAAQSDGPEGRFDARKVPVEVRALDHSLQRLMRSISVKRVELEKRSTELTAANAVLRDEIRERQRIERDLREKDEQLRQSQKLEAVGTLAGGIAHDFNNLLTAVSGFTQLALMEADPKSGMAADLRQVVQAADRAGHLTKQLLAFSRKQVLQPSVLDIAEIVRGLAPMLSRLLGEQVTLRMALDRDIARVMADRGQLEQVLMNLAINARDAMPHGGVLTIGASRALEDGIAGDNAPADQRVILTVSDTGTGIPVEIRERIFEPFFTTKETGRGTGLGLSTVYGIVKQSGGTIYVDSRMGIGTTFTIALPAVSDDAHHDGESAEPPQLPRGSETILLVEDDPAVRGLARRTLEELGYTVLPAADGVEGLRLASSATIDGILSDIVMPQMTGPQLVQRFVAEYPAPVVVFMSGYADEAVLSQGRLLSAAMIRKPFTPATLARTLRDALDSARRPTKVAV